MTHSSLARLLIALLVTLSIGLTACGETPAPATTMPTQVAITAASTLSNATSNSSGRSANASSITEQPYVALSGKAVTLNFWTMALKGNKSFEDYFSGVIARYQKSRPNVKVVWNDYGWISDTEQKLQESLSANTIPDVVNMNTEMSLQYISNNQLQDLSQAMPPQAKTTYFEGLLAATQRGQATYGLPWYVTVPIIIYNKDIFQQAGLDPLKPPNTYEQVFEFSKTIHDKTGVYGYHPVNNLLEELQIEGIQILDPSGKKTTFNNSQAAALYQRDVDLKKGGYVPADAFEQRFEGAVKLFKAGKLGMMVSGASLLTQIQKDSPEVFKNIGVAPAPLGKGNLYPADLMNITVMRGSQHQAEALDFALYLTNDQNQLEFSSLPNVVILPSTKKAASDPFFSRGNDTPISQARKYMAEELKSAKDLYLALPDFEKLDKSMSQNFKAILDSQKTTQQALNDTAEDWDRILAQQTAKK